MFADIIRRFGVARSSKKYRLKKLVRRCGTRGTLSGVTTPTHRISQPVFFGARANATEEDDTVTTCRMTLVGRRRTSAAR